MKNLTHKQMMFCQYYTTGITGKDAAIKAGYSEDCAHTQASENLDKPEIKKYIAEIQEETAIACGLTREKILSEYSKIAFSDLRGFYDEKNNLKSIKDLNPEYSAALASIDIDEIYEFNKGQKENIGITKKIKLHSKIQALDGIVKMLGFNAPEKIENTINIPTLNITPRGEFMKLSNNENDIED